MGSFTDKIKKHRLALCFLSIILLFLSFGIITTRGLSVLEDLTRTIHEHPLVVSNASINAALNITKMHSSMKDAVLANTPDALETELKAVAENEYRVYKELDLVRENILGKKGQLLEQQARELFDSWKPIREEVVRLLKSWNKNEAILITRTKGAEHVAALEQRMFELTSYARQKADNFLSLAETTQSRLELITAVFTIAGVIVSVIIASFAIRLVAKAENSIKIEKDNLQKALDEIKTLHGIIPICSHCKQIRDDKGLWKQMEAYIQLHSEAKFSHDICPDCMRAHYPEEFASLYPDNPPVRS